MFSVFVIFIIPSLLMFFIKMEKAEQISQTTTLSFIDLSPVPRPVNKLPVAMYPSAMPVIIAIMPDPLSNRRNPYSFRSVVPM